MPILKVIEILGSSGKSWEEATQAMVTEAAKTVKNIRSVYVQEMSVKVANNQITEYRVNGKVTFEIES